MRKLLTLLFCFMCFMTTGYAYDQYFNGDPNYEFAFVQMDSGVYVDKNSVESLLYKPPYYKLSAILYSTNKNRDFLSYPSKVTYEYNYDTKQIYECNSLGERIYNESLRTDYNASEHDKRAIAAAKVIWGMAYELDW